MTLSWFPFSIFATVLFGVAMAFYKLPSAKGHDRFAVSFWSLLTPAVLSLIFFYRYLPMSSSGMIWTAFAWGISFTAIVLLQMYALGHMETNALFPITTMASLIVTVLVGIFYFHEYTTPLQTLGIALAVITIFLFVYKGAAIQYSRLLISVGLGIIFISAFNKVLQKVVAGMFDIHAFQIYQYVFAALSALIVYLIVHKKDWKAHINLGSMKAGSLIGVFSFVGGYSLFMALTKGPFPLITSIHSLYTLVTALTAFFLFHERLTMKKVALLFAAIVAVILIRLG